MAHHSNAEQQVDLHRIQFLFLVLKNNLSENVTITFVFLSILVPFEACYEGNYSLRKMVQIHLHKVRTLAFSLENETSIELSASTLYL